MGKRTIILDDEDDSEIDAEENGRGARDTDNDKEVYGGRDEYEKDGFVVDDVDEQDEDEERNDDTEKRKKKRKKIRESKKNYTLDDDDYELLHDNNIVGFDRPKHGSKKFKRLKKVGRNTDEGEQSGFLYDEEVDKNRYIGGTAEEDLKRSLFGDDEGEPLDNIAEGKEGTEEDEYIDEDDEMADFIVDEEEVDNYGARVRTNPNKKKLKHTPGVSLPALQEAHDIFGDVSELLMKHKQGLANSGSFDDSRKQSVKRNEDEFEPFILMDKYATEKDNRIQEIDVPERIQLLEEITGPFPKDDKGIDEESGWIYNQLTVSSMSPFVGSIHLIREITKEDIGNVLRMLHVQKFDIPFIAMYRKELCLSLLKDPEHDEVEGEDNAERKCKLKWHKILWAIQSLDRKWLILQKRKTALQLYYSKRFQEESRMLDDETRLKLIQQIFKSVIESLKASESEREVDDVDSKFNLHFPSGDVMEDGQFRRPKRKSLYSICCAAGLWEVACKFGFSSEQFGSLLNLDKMRVDELEDAKETPEEIAANFTCAMFETPQDVLKGARHMSAVEISCEPCVRKHVRNIFMENATVSTSPTSEGNAAIDSFHQFSSVKWLRDKPISEFKDAQWLLIQKAEEEKLLHVCIKLPETVQTKLMSDSKDCYVSDGVSRSAQLWNEQRELILKDAFFSFLLPSMEREARSLLSVRSKNWLLIEYGQQLWDKVSVAPFKQKENDAGLNDDTAPRVMACCWGPGKPATTFVMLDSSGEVLDVLHAGSINIRSQSVTEQQRRKNDEQRLVKFVMDHQPHVLIVGAVNASSTRLKDEIFEIIFNLIEKHPMEAGQNMSEMAIVFGDESLPRIYENSRVSSDQLTGHQGIVKRAVALGRYLQNPLAMIATLCGPGREILSWKLNPLDHFLGPDEKSGMVEQVMIDATNQVGIDINLAASHEWLFAPLQFVSGLGPRKAHAMKRALIRAGAVFSRKEIPMNGILKKKVFINAIGFLRVRRSGMAATSNRVMDLLDDTRIHPESYDLAKKMAKDVCDEDVQDDPDDKENALEMVIERIRQRPKLLKVLDIEEYSKSMEEQLGMRKRETLADIHLELLHGFQDWRRQYREPNLDDVFYMISGETEDTLLEGRIVQATVRRVQTQRLICELESGLTGVIYKEDFSDESDIELAEKVIEGSIFMCKIKGIQKDRYQVLLSCRLSEPNNEPQSFVKQDPYYHEEKSKLRNAQDRGHKDELLKKFFTPRLILHPHFQNLSADGAMRFLSDKDPGESIIHPSCRGASYLTLTLKVYDHVYAHKVIVECGKDHKDMNSLLRIGKTLKIGESTFEDLDEVMDRYVDPLVTQLKAMLTYRKFKRGSRAEVDERLRAEKLEHPMRIVYGFGISYEHPGNFILSYIRTTALRHEYISLLHNGFKFRKQIFDGNNSVDKLVAYFQKHIDDSGPLVQMISAIAPMRSPSSGGSSVRGSAGGAWGEAPTNSSDGGWRGQSGSNWDRASRPEKGTGGNDSRDAVGQGHPSGIPRPHELGQDHGSDHEKGSDFTSSNWASNSKVGDDEWSKFPGAKVQNSPGGWGDWGSVGGGTGGTLGSASQDGGSNSNWGGNGDVSGSGQSRGTDGWGGVGNESGGNSGRGSGWGDGSGGGGWGGGSSGKGGNDSRGGGVIGGWDHEKNGGTDFGVWGDRSGDGNSGSGGSQVGGSTGDGNRDNWGDGGTSMGRGGRGFRGRDSRGRGGWGSGDSGAWDSGSGGRGNGDGSGSGNLHGDNSGGGRSGWGGRRGGRGGRGDRGGGRVGWEGGGGSKNDSDGSGHWGSGDGDGGGRRGGSRGGRGFGGGRGRGHRGRGNVGGGNGSGSWGNSSENNGGGWGKSDGGGNSGGWGKSDSGDNNGSWSKGERSSSGWGRGSGSGSSEGGWSTSGGGRGGWDSSGGGNCGGRGGWSGSRGSNGGGRGGGNGSKSGGWGRSGTGVDSGGLGGEADGGQGSGNWGTKGGADKGGLGGGTSGQGSGAWGSSGWGSSGGSRGGGWGSNGRDADLGGGSGGCGSTGGGSAGGGSSVINADGGGNSGGQDSGGWGSRPSGKGSGSSADGNKDDESRGKGSSWGARDGVGVGSNSGGQGWGSAVSKGASTSGPGSSSWDKSAGPA